MSMVLSQAIFIEQTTVNTMVYQFNVLKTIKVKSIFILLIYFYAAIFLKSMLE